MTISVLSARLPKAAPSSSLPAVDSPASSAATAHVIRFPGRLNRNGCPIGGPMSPLAVTVPCPFRFRRPGPPSGSTPTRMLSLLHTKGAPQAAARAGAVTLATTPIRLFTLSRRSDMRTYTTGTDSMELRSTNGFVVLIDDEDFSAIESLHINVYRTTRPPHAPYARVILRGEDGQKRSIQLHRFLMDCPSDLQIDHINGNSLDNRRENLRFATCAENQANRGVRRTSKSGVKGVVQTANGRWAAYIQKGAIRRYLGTFNSIQEASKAYDDAARELHGEFARLNQSAA